MEIIEKIKTNKSNNNLTEIQKICLHKLQSSPLPNPKSELWRLSNKSKLSNFLDYSINEKDSKFNQGNTPNGIKQLQEGIRSLLPEAINWPQMEHWWGFRPCTPDLKPIIGKSKIENLFIATGHYRNGVLFSAITSDLLLKIVQNKNLKEIEKSFLKKFSLDRFAI